MVGVSKKAVSAVAGAFAVNLLGAVNYQPARSAWGWFPTGLLQDQPFTCAAGTGGGCMLPPCGAGLTCGVVPKAGYSCDQTSLQVMCINPMGKLIDPANTWGPEGCSNLLGGSRLVWDRSIACGRARRVLALPSTPLVQNASGVEVAGHVTLHRPEDASTDGVHFLQRERGAGRAAGPRAEEL